MYTIDEKPLPLAVTSVVAFCTESPRRLLGTQVKLFALGEPWVAVVM